MRALWRDDVGEFHGEFVELAPSWSWPKPARRTARPCSSAARPGRSCSRTSPSTPTAGSRSAAPASATRCPRCTRACEARGPRPADAADRAVRHGAVARASSSTTRRSASTRSCCASRAPVADRVLPLLDRYAELVGVVTPGARRSRRCRAAGRVALPPGSRSTDGVCRRSGTSRIRIGVPGSGISGVDARRRPPTPTDVDGLPTRVVDASPVRPAAGRAPERRDRSSIISCLVRRRRPHDRRVRRRSASRSGACARTRGPGFRQTFLRAGEVDRRARRRADREPPADRAARRGSSASRAPSPISTRARSLLGDALGE